MPVTGSVRLRPRSWDRFDGSEGSAGMTYWLVLGERAGMADEGVDTASATVTTGAGRDATGAASGGLAATGCVVVAAGLNHNPITRPAHSASTAPAARTVRQRGGATDCFTA